MESARKRDEEKNVRVAEDTVVMTKPPLPTPPVPPVENVPAAKQDAPDQAPPPAADAATQESSGPGDEFIVVQTYDGKWHPTDEEKK